ncbi:hypothetical protein ILYODFUR_034979 [Ilyodon furcidens]|uniref:RING-type domain-containing protein n=1 Tax=Ilyodon furcidens TaxID=33524 RepID=A0ABV0TPF8_9TELE
MEVCVEKEEDEAESPGPSCLSMRSDQSKDQPVAFCKEPGASDKTGHHHRQTSEPSVSSCVSLKSDCSKEAPLVFNHGPGSSETKGRKRSCVYVDDQVSSCALCQDALKDPVSSSCGHWFCRQCISSYWEGFASSRHPSCPQCGKTSRSRAGQQTTNQGSCVYGKTFLF